MKKMIGLLFSVLLVSTMSTYTVHATNLVDDEVVQIQLDESEVTPYAIATETWYSDCIPGSRYGAYPYFDCSRKRYV